MNDAFSTTSIRTWSEEERPRERAMANGIRGMTAAECLALVLRSGTRAQSALDLARSVLAQHEGSLSRLARADVLSLQGISGVGLAKAAAVAAAFELGRRSASDQSGSEQVVRGSHDVFQLLNPRLSSLDHEQFWVVYLSRANKVVHYECVGQGGWTATSADVRVVYQRALALRTPSMVVAHNHPSGRLEPSDEDRRLTQRLVEGARILELSCLDHLIIGENQYVSFADRGWMP
ncbi:MAG: DNA repair protein RadC [Bacteroidetes bacterium]|nr:DNA repair protein RadC [Bacteroidota bacterium]